MDQLFPELKIPGVRIRLVMLTPEAAQYLLDCNTHNRPIVEGYVMRLIAAFERGEHYFNGSSVVIGDNGVLLDGQHRAMAVKKSGISIPVVLVTGVEQRAQATMDVGRKRKYADHLALNGETNAISLEATIRLCRRYDLGLLAQDRRSEDTSFFVLDKYFDESLKELREATRAGGATSQKIPLRKSAAAALHYITNRIEPFDSELFFHGLVTGADLGAGDPRLVFRNYLYNLEKVTTSRTETEHILAVGIKAWNFYRDGKRIKLLHYKPLDEAYPVAR